MDCVVALVKDPKKSNVSTVDLMEAGTTEQCLNTEVGAIKGENQRKRKPAAHSPQDTHFLSVSLTQHQGGG